MNLRFVEAFVWVARLKSITRGAKKLYLTQSAVSNRVAALEEELGVQLLDRRATGFRLTDAGIRFLEYANQLLALQNELMNELGTPEQRPFSLRIGAIESVLHTWLIPLMDSLKKNMPKIEYELTVEMTHVLNEQLRSGMLDLVFSAAQIPGEGIVNETLAPLEMVFVGPEKLADRDSLPLHEILAHDLLTFQRGSQPHVALTETLRAAGIANKHVHAISSISAQVRLVESGFGITTLPLAVARQLVMKYRIAILSAPQTLPPLPLFASYWDVSSTPAVQQAMGLALQFAKDWAAERQPNATIPSAR